jgi:hypothetical protein
MRIHQLDGLFLLGWEMLIAAADLIIACWRRLRLFRKKKSILGFLSIKHYFARFVANHFFLSFMLSVTVLHTLCSSVMSLLFTARCNFSLRSSLSFSIDIHMAIAMHTKRSPQDQTKVLAI